MIAEKADVDADVEVWVVAKDGGGAEESIRERRLVVSESEVEAALED